VVAFLIFFVYLVESLASVRRVMAIRSGSYWLLGWDALLTALPFLVLSGWESSSGAGRFLVVLAAIVGSQAGCIFSGAVRNDRDKTRTVSCVS
jgi:hypothetical protein